MSFQVSGIPQIASGTVPDAERRLFQIEASGPLRIRHAAILVTAVGSHTNYVATIEGSYDGAQFFNLANAVLNPILPAGVTLNENGIVLPSNAIATTGLVLVFQDLNFIKYRLGLAGDSNAGDGSAIILVKQP